MSQLIRATIQATRPVVEDLGGYAYCRGRVVETLKQSAMENQYVLDEESVVLEQETALGVRTAEIQAFREAVEHGEQPVPPIPAECPEGDEEWTVVALLLHYSAMALTVEEAATRLLPEGWEHAAPRPTLPPSDSPPSETSQPDLPSEHPALDPVPAPTAPTNATTPSRGSTRTSRTTSSSAGRPGRKRLRRDDAAQ